MKKIAVILNTSEVGGAERSVLLQSTLVNDSEFDFFIPKLSEEIPPIRDYIEEKIRFKQIIEFKLPKSYYNISRNSFRGMFSAFFSLFFLFKNIFFLKINAYDVVWLNGNKVAYPFVVILYLKRFKKKIIWHLRDYPSKHLKILSFFFKRLNIQFIANSHSVASAMKKVSDTLPIDVIYNPVGATNSISRDTKIKNIGIVAMFTPWKGIHQVISMVNMYEKELKELGIENVLIYGDAIYKTLNRDHEYKEELKQLSKSNLITFKGLVPSKEAFTNIDILIHSSIKEEPFGRVIAEAFQYKIPVISTGLGGSGELVHNNKTGLIFTNFDYDGLFQCIKKIIDKPKVGWDVVCL